MLDETNNKHKEFMAYFHQINETFHAFKVFHHEKSGVLTDRCKQKCSMRNLLNQI